MNQSIFSILLFSLIVSCNSEKSTQIQNAQPTNTHVQSTKVIKSNSFTINNINCYWVYQVSFNKPDDSMVTILKKELKSTKGGKVLLNYNLNLLDTDPTIPIIELLYIDTQPNAFDVNFDGYTDFQFTDLQTSGNNLCFVYTFNPKKRHFEYAKSFSGQSLSTDGIILDHENKKAIYTSKGGGGIYFTSHIYFNTTGKMQRREDFWNAIDHTNTDSDSISLTFYHKSISNSIQESQTTKQIPTESSLEFIYKKFNHWVNTFHSK